MAEDQKPRVEFVPDGPIVVRGMSELRNSRGEAVECRDPAYLCQCGASGNKPFCDGSHKAVEHKSARQIDPELIAVKNYSGTLLTVHYNAGFCSGAGHCVSLSPRVFDLDARPWIRPDVEPVDRVIATVDSCPSGALSYTRDGVHHRDDAERLPSIHIDRNGPYLVVGGVEVVTEVQPPSPEHYTLCRCGQSRNLPYCDGAHLDVNFQDDEN